jgi:glutaminyl-peptide cyclotransferase
MRLLLRRLAVLILLPAISLQVSTLGRRNLVQLSANDIAALVSTTDPVKNIDPANPASHLSKILIPRVADTGNNTIVRNYIIDTMRSLKWHITEDEFTADTPLGKKKFTNVIATKDPSASRRVILSAHFDSKYFEHFEVCQPDESLHEPHSY